ncbi:MAG TPA: hypothetical protein DDZ41_12425, partial [Flavobacterium sp.]|nr:hypothetical protein [Flavobacterium sp.]
MKTRTTLWFCLFFTLISRAQQPDFLYLPNDPIGTSNPVNHNINEIVSTLDHQDVKRAVCQIYYPLENNEFKVGTGVLMNTLKNTYSSDKRNLFIITDSELLRNGSDTLYLSFNYEMANDLILENNVAKKNITKVHKFSFKRSSTNLSANLALIELEVHKDEINNPKSPIYNAYALGWNLHYFSDFIDEYLSINIHHPSADSKKVSIGTFMDQSILPSVNYNNGSFKMQPYLYIAPQLHQYEPDAGSSGSPLMHLLDKGLIGVKKNDNTGQPHFSAIENNWYKTDEDQPGFIHYLDPNYTWMSHLPGGYIKDLVPLTDENIKYTFYPLSNNSASFLNIKPVANLFLEEFGLNKPKREDLLGAGLKMTNLATDDIYLFFHKEFYLFYGIKLKKYDTNPLSKPFQGEALNPSIELDNNLLNLFTNSSQYGFDSSNFKANYISYFNFLNQYNGNPDFESIFAGVASQLNPLQVLLYKSSQDSNFNVTATQIQAIRLPFHMPMNALEVFNPQLLINNWKSKKYPFSYGIDSPDLYIDKVNLYQAFQLDKTIETGDNGGYLNLVNPHYYFESIKTSVAGEQPSELIVKINVENILKIPYKCKVWIDFFPLVANNNTYDFDELSDFGIIDYLEDTTYPNIDSTFTFSYKMPYNYTLGMQPGEERYVRMRVAICDDRENISSNGIYEMGDVEDYMLKLYAPTPLETLTAKAAIYLPFRSGFQTGIENNACGVPIIEPEPLEQKSYLNVGDATTPYACNSFVCSANDCQTTALNSTSTVNGDYSVCISGTNDFVALDQGKSILNNSFTARTVSFWIDNSTTSGIKTIYDEGGSTEGGMGIQINNTTNKLQLGVRNGTTLKTVTADLANTQWVHVA